MTSEIEIPKSDNKLNILLDASKLDMFETCPERYNYRYNLNRGVPITDKSRALDLGTVGHVGGERYYTLLSEGIKFNERIAETRIALGAHLADVNQSNLSDEDSAHIIDTMIANLEYWRADDENCLEILAVEQPFVYLVYSSEILNFYMTGKIDLLVNYHGIGRNASYKDLVIDHKTYSRESEVLRKNNQFTNYCIATGSSYLLVNRIGLQKSKNPDEKFKRIPLSYDPIYKEDWKANVGTIIEQEYLPAVLSGIWPEKGSSCYKFNRICEYYRVCDTSGEDTKVFKLANEFVDADVWDVSKGLER